jgi:hypothetical protein
MFPTVKTASLKTRPPFSRLFDVAPDVLGRIRELMKDGFDPAHPIVVRRGEDVVVDGHTRLEGARAVGIEEVPICEVDFAGEFEALEYAVTHQRSRRQMTDAEIYRSAVALDCRVEHGGDRRSGHFKGKIFLALASWCAILGKSQRIGEIRSVAIRRRAGDFVGRINENTHDEPP